MSEEVVAMSTSLTKGEIARIIAQTTAAVTAFVVAIGVLLMPVIEALH
jgi:hypothetical protein